MNYCVCTCVSLGGAVSKNFSGIQCVHSICIRTNISFPPPEFQDQSIRPSCVNTTKPGPASIPIDPRAMSLAAALSCEIGAGLVSDTVAGVSVLTLCVATTVRTNRSEEYACEVCHTQQARMIMVTTTVRLCVQIKLVILYYSIFPQLDVHFHGDRWRNYHPNRHTQMH